MLENKEQRVKELQELYRQFILDKLGVDVNNQLGGQNETTNIHPSNI
jgi:hypothetical protein